MYQAAFISITIVAYNILGNQRILVESGGFNLKFYNNYMLGSKIYYIIPLTLWNYYEKFYERG